MTNYPADITHIARRRQEGALEHQIAAELGLDTRALRRRIRNWKRRNPARPLPRATLRPEVPFYVQAANLRKSEKLTDKQIAKRMGKALTTVHVYLTKARAKGLLPSRGQREQGGRKTWEHYKNKGAAVPLGTMSRVLDDLSMEQVEQLLRCLTREDKTLADLLARILKEYLNAQQA